MIKRSSVKLYVTAVAGPLFFAVLISLLTMASAPPPQPNFFPNARDKPIRGWAGPVFRLSQQYPRTQPRSEDYPWKKYDFKTQWKEYMLSVLSYCYEGNLDVDWVVQNNRVRPWYHAPWLHWGRSGREFVHGLTHERVTEPGELAPTQTSRFQNWAVSVYNAPGGHVVGKVWRNRDSPDPSAAQFPDGTVSVKLLFTQATVDQVPYLRGSKEWQAHIYQEIKIPTDQRVPRTIQTLRLLQIDIAVRDSRADATTGWVFGTFVYNGEAAGNNPWEKMVPVGLMWGNDPGVTEAMVKGGHKLKETIINPSRDLPPQHLGWGKRLNGPVDNPKSSCLSCHSTAQWPVRAPLVPPRKASPDSPEWMRWFRNIKAQEAFTPGLNNRSLGYSLQLMSGLQNFHEWRRINVNRGGAYDDPSPADSLNTNRGTRMRDSLPQEYPVSREGFPDQLPEP